MQRSTWDDCMNLRGSLSQGVLKSFAFVQIHGGVGGSPGDWEVHISYHNGDHYNRQEMNSFQS